MPKPRWSEAELQDWFRGRGLELYEAEHPESESFRVFPRVGLWPRAEVQVRRVRTGGTKWFPREALVVRDLQSYVLEVDGEADCWRIRLKRDPRWLLTIFGLGLVGTAALSWPLAAAISAKGLAPTWGFALLQLGLACLPAIPAAIAVAYVRGGLRTKAMFIETLRELGRVAASAGG